jgi:hypothetical protein
MAKKQDFLSKLAKGQIKGEACPTCENIYTYVKKVDSYLSEDSQTWKYRTMNLKVCSCNEKDVYA